MIYPQLLFIIFTFVRNILNESRIFNQPISCNWSLSITPENASRGYKKRSVA